MKFCAFYTHFTGKVLDYPEDYVLPKYTPIREYQDHDNEDEPDKENQPVNKKRRLNEPSTSSIRLTQPGIVTPPPSLPTAQFTQQTFRSQVDETNKISIGFPAALPEFSPAVFEEFQKTRK